jgi:prepilin-type N-terminal cleavage/methylation domain-containing protein
MKVMRTQKGFSLIELLIVVAIILIIAAIAIPNLMRSRIAANDSAAAANVRTLNSSEVTYTTTYPTAGYVSLYSLGTGGSTTCPTGATTTGACLIDPSLGCSASTGCVKDAFAYTITVEASAQDYVIGAVPVSTTAADKDFCSLPDAVIRYLPDTGGTPQAVVTTDTACNGFTSL